MIIFVSILLIVLLLCWSKHKEGLTQSCTDQEHLQKTCNKTGKPVPFCFTNVYKTNPGENAEDKAECIPFPKDGKCPANFPIGKCPEVFDVANSSCITFAELGAKSEDEQKAFMTRIMETMNK
jgi:hypothetical protein